jgi:4,5-DOPA dioxygenase extradiol
MTLNELKQSAQTFPSTSPMPVLFVGHGNPMNAITENRFTRGWEQVGESLPRPHAVLCISAHWETTGTFVTAMEKPRTIHDFGGFPRELYEVQYPAQGSPELAGVAKRTITQTSIELDHAWGLDHGCWSVIMHMFPKADVPVLQLSLDHTKPPEWHYALARELAPFRSKGVLIVGSGNIVHNLQLADWDANVGFDWALAANDRLKNLAAGSNHQALINYRTLGREVQLAVPTPEHYLPLLYALALKEEKDAVSLFNDQTELGSISMTSLRIDRP